MRVVDSIRYLSRDIIKGYVKHIQHKINTEDISYILSGVDKDLDTYESLFEVVIGVLFKKSESYGNFAESIVQDCVGILEIVIEDSKYKRAMKYSDGVYDTCLMIYKKVAQGVIEHADREK